MSYSDQCERWAAEGLSGSEASHYASSGMRPDYGPPEAQEEAPGEPTENDYSKFILSLYPYCQKGLCLRPSIHVVNPHKHNQLVLCSQCFKDGNTDSQTRVASAQISGTQREETTP